MPIAIRRMLDSRLPSAVGVALALLWLPLGALTAAADRDAPEADRPVGNETFADVITRGRIPQRFEMYNPRSKEQLQAVKEMGFTQVILDRPQLHAEATQLGLNVVLANWWTGETKPEEIEQGIGFAKQVDPRRLVAVSMMDEPERYAPDTPPSYYQSLYETLRARFDKELPGVGLEISHWGPLASWTPRFYKAFVPIYRATDRIRLMPYPDLFEGPLSDVYYQMIRSRRVMRLADRELPQVVILQTWVLPEEPKLPTIDELRVMAYLAMLSGADTLSFYNYDPEAWSKTEGFTEGFAQLMKELTDFSRRHCRATVESRMSPAGLFTATLRSPGGPTISMVVNTNRTALDDVPALAVIECEPVLHRRVLRLRAVGWASPTMKSYAVSCSWWAVPTLRRARSHGVLGSKCFFRNSIAASWYSPSKRRRLPWPASGSRCISTGRSRSR